MIEASVAAGVVLRIAAPEGAHDEPESALPTIDVSAVPGARVVLRRGFTDGRTIVRAACVIAPSDRWAPGVEELVLGRATGLAIAGIGAPVDRWEPAAITAASSGFDQRLVGRAGDREVAGIGHALAFVGPEHEVLLCSVTCADGGAHLCGDVIAGSGLRGLLTGPPPPSLLVRSVLFAATRPYEVAFATMALAVLVSAWMILRRPRVPARR